MKKKISLLASFALIASCMPFTALCTNAAESENDTITSLIVSGDVNGDGVCTIADAIIMQKWLLSEPDSAILDLKAADLNNNGRIDIFDFILLKQELLSGIAASQDKTNEAKPLLVIEEFSSNKNAQHLLVYDSNGTAYRRFNSDGYAAYADEDPSHVENNIPYVKFNSNENWYDTLEDIISRPYAKYDALTMDEADLSYTKSMSAKTKDYQNAEWLKSETQRWDGIDLSIYIIDTTNNEPSIAKLCTLIRYDECLDDKDVQDFVREICKKGYTDIPDLDLEFDLYLKHQQEKIIDQ